MCGRECPLRVQTVKGFVDKITGTQTEFYEYKGQGHGFMNSANQDIREKMDSELPPPLAA